MGTDITAESSEVTLAKVVLSGIVSASGLGEVHVVQNMQKIAETGMDYLNLRGIGRLLIDWEEKYVFTESITA